MKRVDRLRIKLAFLATTLATASLLFATPSHAVSLSSLIEGGGSIGLEDKVFSNFGFSTGFGTATFDAPADIDVTVGLIDGHVALSFAITGCAFATPIACGSFPIIQFCGRTVSGSVSLLFDALVEGSTELIEAVTFDAGLSAFTGGPFGGGGSAQAHMSASFFDIDSSLSLGSAGLTDDTVGSRTAILDPQTRALHVSSMVGLSATSTGGVTSIASASLNGITFIFDQISASSVPEPGSLALLAAALAGFGFGRRKGAAS